MAESSDNGSDSGDGASILIFILCLTERGLSLDCEKPTTPPCTMLIFCLETFLFYGRTVRTYGRMNGSKTITDPSAQMALPMLSMGGLKDFLFQRMRNNDTESTVKMKRVPTRANKSN